MKKFLIITLVILTTTAAFSQRAPGLGMRGARIQGLRIEFITRHLKLTPEETPFWTVFYQYTNELRKARLEQPDDVIATEEKILNIKKKYRPDFKRVLGSDERVMKVFTIDKEFNNMLKAELQKRGSPQQY